MLKKYIGPVVSLYQKNCIIYAIKKMLLYLKRVKNKIVKICFYDKKI